MERILLGISALCCAAAAMAWFRALLPRRALVVRLVREQADLDTLRLAQVDERRDELGALTMAACTLTLAMAVVVGVPSIVAWASLAPGLAGLMTFLSRHRLTEATRLAAARTEVAKRAQEVLSQE
jgi:hypothetical protein